MKHIMGKNPIMDRLRVFLAMLLLYLASAGVCAAGDNHFTKGLGAAREGNLDAAVKEWSKYIDRHPRTYIGYANRGRAYLLTGHVMKGLSDWSKAKDYAPPFAYATYNEVFITQVDSDDKLMNYVLSLELDPEYVASIISTGLIYQEVYRSDAAVQLYKKARELTKNPQLKSEFENWIEQMESGKPK
jgi:tetratricopeptide (TPR) repeat protein